MWVAKSLICLLFSLYAFINLLHSSLVALQPCVNSPRSEFKLTFKGNNFAGRVHDGTICRDGPADGIVRVGQIYDDNLGLLTHFLPDTDELVRLHGQSAEANVGWVDSQVLELRRKNA